MKALLGKILQDREGIIFWGTIPLVMVRKEKLPKPIKIRLTKERARQMIWASRFDPKMRRSLQKVAAVTFWKALGF